MCSYFTYPLIYIVRSIFTSAKTRDSRNNGCRPHVFRGYWFPSPRNKTWARHHELSIDILRFHVDLATDRYLLFYEWNYGNGGHSALILHPPRSPPNLAQGLFCRILSCCFQPLRIFLLLNNVFPHVLVVYDCVVSTNKVGAN